MSERPGNYRVPFDQLAALVAVHQTGSVAAAAVTLGVSQPAVTSLLQRLQRNFRQPLFASDRNRKVLTAHGLVLLETVIRPVSELQDAYGRFARLFETPENLSLRFAARQEIIQRLAARIDFPGRIEFLSMSGQEIEEALREHRCDVGVTQRRVEDPRFYSQEVFSSTVSLCVPERFLGRASSLDEVLDHGFFTRNPFIAYGEDVPFVGELAANLGRALTPLRIVRTCGDWYGVAGMVEAGVGFSMIPDEFVAGLKNTRIWPIPGELVAPSCFSVICLHELMTVPAVRVIIDGLGALAKGGTPGQPLDV